LEERVSYGSSRGQFERAAAEKSQDIKSNERCEIMVEIRRG